MSDKPTELPEWGMNDTATEITEPSAADKLTGWVPDEQPAAQHMNWLQHRIYLWSKWLSDGIFQRSSLTDNTPVLQTCDRDARPRHYLGPEGYWMGPAIERVYEPEETSTLAGFAGPTFLSSGLNANADANVTVYETTAGAGENHPTYRILVQSAATGNQGGVLYRAIPHQDIDDVCIVFELRARLDTIGSNGADAFIGLVKTSAKTVPSIGEHAGILKLASDTNWQMSVADGTTQTTSDTGTPPVAATYQTFRLEYHGANTPVGVDNSTAPVVRFFIDGVDEGEISDANVPTTADGGLTFSVVMQENTPGGDINLHFSPVRYAYNQVLDGDIPA